jgi:DnaJ-class molecular chaperone
MHSDRETYLAIVPCPACDGAGEWDEGPLPASSGALEPEYRQVICSECEGTGRVFAEPQPVTLEDLQEQAEQEG